MLYDVTIGCDKNIIHIDNDVTFSQVIMKEVVHHHLKCCRRVSETKEHNLWFKKSSICLKCGFPLVAFLDSYIIVAPLYVELCEELLVRKLVINSLMSGKGYLLRTVHLFSAL